MGSGFWEQVAAGGRGVPTDRPLDEVTAELTAMLGSTDPREREDCARALLTTWIRRGVYDDLLGGLGDGMTSGLTVGIGERGTDSVFRRSLSAAVLGECIERDNERQILPSDRLLAWGDRLAAWFVREHDLRGHVENKGWAHAVAHGADALAALAGSRALSTPELTVLLDVLADRLLLPTDELLVTGEADRLATATIRILRRDVVPLGVLEPWVNRLAHAANGVPETGRRPDPMTFNTATFLRALHLHLALRPSPAGQPRPAVRSDLLLALVDALRSVTPTLREGR